MTSMTQAAVLLADQQPAGTTHLGERLAWVFGLLLLVAAVYALMWRAWRRRGGRHGLPPLPEAPAAPAGEPRLTLTGRYHGTTTSGDWLDRVVAHGLGARSLAELTLDGRGVTVRRPGAGSFLIPAGAVRGARTDKGIAGKVLTEDGLLVIVWEHGGRLLDSGFRAEHPADHAPWVRALRALADGTAAGGERSPESPGRAAVPARHPLHDPSHDTEGAT